VIRLQLGLPAVGKGQHRSGWPYAVRSLELLHSRDGIVFDDFVERTIVRSCRAPYEEPWVGVFHNPHRAPWWFDHVQTPQTMLEHEGWITAAPHLKLGFTLSEYLAEWWREAVPGVPFVSLMHPTEFPPLQWQPDEFLHNGNRQLIQVGWWLRNTEAIYQLEPVPGWTKVALKLEYPWVQDAEERVRAYWRHNPDGRKRVGQVVDVPRLENVDYDEALSRNVVFVELFDSSANNAVVECIARDTPILCNRHPAVVEYLGNDYPLFFDHFEEAGKLLEPDRVVAAHEYLKEQDKSPFTGAQFRERVRAEVLRVLEE